MSFALYRNEHDLHTVFSTGIPGISGHRVRLIGGIRLNDLRSHVTAVKNCPLFHVIRYTSVSSVRMIGISIIIYHIIGCTMRMNDGYGTSTGRITVVYRYTAHRTEGRNLITHPCHGMICHHTAHGKTGQVHPVTVDMVTIVHRVDNRLQELYIRIAGYVPSLVDSIGIDHHELGRIGHGLPICLSFLIVGILVQSVQ